MFKNNLKVFIYYFLVLGITYGILTAFDTLYRSSTTQFNNLVMKVFFAIFYVLLFIICGKIVSIKEHPSKDFLNFLLVFIVGLGLFFLAYLGGGMDFSQDMNILMLPAQVFLSPFILLSTITGRRFDILFYIITSLLISVVIGLSTRRTRVKRRYKSKIKRR
ncbi:MAG: hypothetical protein GX666_05925 [Tissierellia bacterium]|nr:hypothetical protein [Tissierellia bacterium]